MWVCTGKGQSRLLRTGQMKCSLRSRVDHNWLYTDRTFGSVPVTVNSIPRLWSPRGFFAPEFKAYHFLGANEFISLGADVADMHHARHALHALVDREWL